VRVASLTKHPTTAAIRAGLTPRRIALALGGALLTLIVAPVLVAASTNTPLSTSGALHLPQAILLGLVEGITEFLPISSTGHLLIVERILGLGDTAADKVATDAFTVIVQVGAILAVVGIFRNRFTLMIEGVTKRSVEGRRLLLALAVAFVPAALVGKVFGDKVKEHLLSPGPVAIAWFVGGLAIIAFVSQQHRLKAHTLSISDITWQQGLIIGVAQILALWPGTSRSLVTILAGLLLGLSLQAAVEFSFILGFATLSAATLYELAKDGKEMFAVFGYVSPIVGTIVAGIAAWVSVKWMITYLEKRPLTVFGWYRIGAALVAVGLMLGKVV
jgi:undecaprenyl-diphosphatase